MAFGRTLFHPSTPDSEYDAMRAAWNELRDELLPDWIAEHPGTRPWSWWRFDAPSIGPRLDTARISSASGKPIPEDELTYLRRHGLLTEAELAGCSC